VKNYTQGEVARAHRSLIPSSTVKKEEYVNAYNAATRIRLALEDEIRRGRQAVPAEAALALVVAITGALGDSDARAVENTLRRASHLMK
jgi:hypothetical protein